MQPLTSKRNDISEEFGHLFCNYQTKCKTIEKSVSFSYLIFIHKEFYQNYKFHLVNHERMAMHSRFIPIPCIPCLAICCTHQETGDACLTEKDFTLPLLACTKCRKNRCIIRKSTRFSNRKYDEAMKIKTCTISKIISEI